MSLLAVKQCARNGDMSVMSDLNKKLTRGIWTEKTHGHEFSGSGKLPTEQKWLIFLY